MARLNDLLVHAPWLGVYREALLPEKLASGSLGSPGVVASELAALELRLGCHLCPSYRALLQVSNGFALFGQHVGRLLPAAEVDRYRIRNPRMAEDIEDWLRAGNPLRPPYPDDPAWREDILLRAIEIAEEHDACTLLLLPDAANAAGEWEVWLRIVSSYYRYETLPDYVDAMLRSLAEPPPS